MEKPTWTKSLLVFNPSAGAPEESPSELMEALISLQRAGILPIVYLVTPEIRLDLFVRDAVRSGIRLVVVDGGDGTIDQVACGLAGTRAVLGIIPGGTQNNIARSLGIPLGDVEAAVMIIKDGNFLKIDMGLVRYGPTRRYFLEAAGIGLISDLFPAADDIQHGNLARLGDLLATFFTSEPSSMRLDLDRGNLKVETAGHLLLVANMPYLGLQFQPAEHITCQDGLLDIIVYSNLTKLDLIGYAVLASGSPVEDARVQHFQVKSISVNTEPNMQLIVDGVVLGEGAFAISVKPGCLNAMAPKK
jgi:YegS/Rv2252/BmrU family lipid kinase